MGEVARLANLFASRSGGGAGSARRDGTMRHQHPHPTSPNRYAIRLRILPPSRGKVDATLAPSAHPPMSERMVTPAPSLPKDFGQLSLTEAAEWLAARKLPPVEQWHPDRRGDSLMEIRA